MLRLLVFILAFGSFSSLLFAQQYSFRTYSLEEGLPQSEVRAFIQDSKHNLWVGTNGGGLSRFNGRTFETYTKKHGLPDNNITALFEDSDGNLWIGTTKGISKYDGREFHNFGVPEGMSSGFFFRIMQDNDGKIWAWGFHNQGGTFMLALEDGVLKNLTPEYEELNDENRILSVFLNKNGVLQLTTMNGLYDLNSKGISYSEINNLSELKDKFIFPFLNDNKGNLWIGAGGPNIDNQFFTYKDGVLTPVTLHEEMATANINFAMEDSHGSIWFSLVRKGVLKYTPQNSASSDEKFQFFTRQNGLPISFINVILEDHEGNIWLATNGAGLAKYSSDKFTALNAETGLSSEIIRSLFQDSKGNYWFGTAAGALIKYDGLNIENVLKEEDSQLGFVRNFHELGNGNLLLATYNGLWEFDGKDFTSVNEKYGLQEGSGVADLIVNGDEWWIAAFGEGLHRIYGQNRRLIEEDDDGNPIDNVTHLMKDSKGNLWITSNLKGITKFEPGTIEGAESGLSEKGEKITNFNAENGLNNDFIMQSAEDKYGNIWFATYGGGLNIYDGKNFSHIDMEDGLTSDNIYSVITDDEGNIWAGTQNGVDKITIDERGEVTSIENFDKYDGFTGIEANGMANYKDREGNLWFGTIKGAMRYKPGADKFNPIAPSSQITRLKLFFKDVDWDKGNEIGQLKGTTPWFNLPSDLSMPHDQNHLTFDFEALSFKVPEKVMYQWKLEGLDKDWSPATNRTDAVYANIPPGAYTFMVKASNNDNVWNEEPSTFSFVIRPPWYGTWWFRIFTVLLTAAGVYFVYKWRVRSIQEKKTELEGLVKEKTVEVVKQKDEILEQSRKLEKSYQNLELLSDVGKEITSNLKVEKIVQAVYENVNAIMDANVFWIGVFNENRKTIEFRGAIEEGRKLPSFDFNIKDDDRLAVWCFKNQKEVFINDYELEHKNYISEDRPIVAGKPAQSIIYLPLKKKGKCMGVISVQSRNKNAYREHHLSLLRNVAVHTNIALENAQAYEKMSRQSDDLQQQKVEIEQKNLELSDLNAEKNHLIGIVAHDLRNPLTSAMTFSAIFNEENDNLTEDQKEYNGHILNALNRMNDMVSRILDIKSIESKSLNMQFEKVNLDKVLKQVVLTLKKPIEEKKLKLNMQLDASDAYTSLDVSYTTQVFENLISNAIKFSSAGTQITIRSFVENGQLLTEIQDEGPGLTQEDMQHLFKKYQTLSAKPTAGESSTGLGLSIVKKYVDAMDGNVWCESTPGQGAKFIVAFGSC